LRHLWTSLAGAFVSQIKNRLGKNAMKENFNGKW